MKTINLPEGNAFGVDDDDSGTPYVNYAEQRAKTLFFVWVSLTEHQMGHSSRAPRVQTDERLNVGIDGLASDDAKAYSTLAQQGKNLVQQIRLIHGDGFPEGECFHEVTALSLARLKVQPKAKSPGDLAGRGFCFLIRATSYSPTHSRVQYHRGCKA